MITVELIKSKRPCSDYGSKKLAELLGSGKRPGACLAPLLSLPKDDARWVLSRLLPNKQLIQWANMAAVRAKGYANAYNAAKAATHAAYGAAYAAARANAIDAAYYAAYAANAAYGATYAANADRAACAAYDAEHKLCCVIGLELLCEVYAENEKLG